MAWFEDQSPCTYFGDGLAPVLRAVGWLERGRPIAAGAPDRRVLDKLRELRSAFREFAPMWYLLHSSFGYHYCDLDSECQNEGGTRNLFLPGDTCIFVAPELIVHYIERHGYGPPDEFCVAVLRCPPIDSPAYLDALRAHGGAVLIGAGDH